MTLSAFFKTFFKVCSVNKLPFPNCKEAYWVSKRPVKDFFSGRMARIRPQNDKFRAKAQGKRTADSPGCNHDRQHWGKHYCSPEKPCTVHSKTKFHDEIRRNSLFIHQWFYVTYLTTSPLWQILYFVLSKARWIDLNDSLFHETSLYYFICKN